MSQTKPKKKGSKASTSTANKKRPKFEECLPQIDIEIAKRRGKWGLTALAWMDFDDVSQILRIHIYKKWNLYDPEKNLLPWIRTIISNQIKNLIRNNYTNFVKPCNRCAAAQGADGCEIYKTQCSDCPLFKNWERNKKSAFNTKMPVPLENHAQEVHYLSQKRSIDVEKTALKIHRKMKEALKRNEWLIYKYLYIEHKTELQVAKLMGYKTSEKNRSPGYKQIKNIKKKIIARVRSCLENDEIDY